MWETRTSYVLGERLSYGESTNSNDRPEYTDHVRLSPGWVHQYLS